KPRAGQSSALLQMAAGGADLCTAVHRPFDRDGALTCIKELSALPFRVADNLVRWTVAPAAIRASDNLDFAGSAAGNSGFLFDKHMTAGRAALDKIKRLQAQP